MSNIKYITTKELYFDKNVVKININSKMIDSDSKQLTTDQWYCIKEKSGIYLAWDGREYIQGGCNYCDKYFGLYGYINSTDTNCIADDRFLFDLIADYSDGTILIRSKYFGWYVSNYGINFLIRYYSQKFFLISTTNGYNIVTVDGNYIVVIVCFWSRFLNQKKKILDQKFIKK